jgi:hypothetical protein
MVNTRRRVSSQTKRYLERIRKSKLSLITGMTEKHHFSDTRGASFSNLGQDCIYPDRFLMGFLSPYKYADVVTPLRHDFDFPSTPNDPYRGRTAPLTSKRCILYIYSTNIGTEYFKHGIYSPFFLFKMQFVS